MARSGDDRCLLCESWERRATSDSRKRCSQRSSNQGSGRDGYGRTSATCLAGGRKWHRLKVYRASTRSQHETRVSAPISGAFMHNFNRGSTYRSICQCPSLPFSVPPIACTSPRPTSSSHGLQQVSGLAYMCPHMTPFAKSASLLDSFNAQYRIPRLRSHQSPTAPPRLECCPAPIPDSPGPPRGRPWFPRPTRTT